MRQPGQLLRDLGLPGFLTFQLIVGGNALAALVHPLFTAELFYLVLGGAPMWRGDSASVVILAAVYGMTVVIGYLTSAFLGWLGLLRRGLLSTAWILLLTPVHGSVARLVGIEGGVVSGVFNLESSGVDAERRRIRHSRHQPAEIGGRFRVLRLHPDA